MHTSDGTFVIERRAVFTMLAATVAASAARSQVLTDARDAELLFSDVDNLLRNCIDVPVEEITFSLLNLISSELDGRRTLSDSLIESGFNDDYETLRFKVIDSTPSYVGEGTNFQLPQVGIDSQIALLDEIRSQGLQLVPPAREMVPANITSLPNDPFPEFALDSDLVVVFDILVDAMGIGVNPQAIIIALVEADPEWEAKMKELVSVISTRDWHEVINAIQIIILAIISPAVWAILKQTLKSGGRRALYALGLRLLPIIGPGYIAAAFLISLKQNWSRFSFA